MSFPEHCTVLQEIKAASGLTFAQIADHLGKPEVWTAALFYGSAVSDVPTAEALFKLFEGNKGAADHLAKIEGTQSGGRAAVFNGLVGKGPSSLGVEGMIVRGQGWECPPKDPVLYRLYEVLLDYGWSYKALIKEKFGDGIMSAIDFHTSVEREPNPKGDRVKITMSGKYLAYSGTDSWASDGNKK